MLRAATRFVIAGLLLLLCGLEAIELMGRADLDEIRELEKQIRAVELRQAKQQGVWTGWRNESRAEHWSFENEDARLRHYHMKAPPP